MSTAVQHHAGPSVQNLASNLEQALIAGNLDRLNPQDRLQYYKAVCESIGLNPLTKPFEYITLNGKLTLYARKDCTDQLRMIHNVSVQIASREVIEGVYVVTARATMPNGRQDESLGAVPIDNLKGEARSNAMMKAETKSKRRVTLSICGLGMLDETEIDSIEPYPRNTPAQMKEIAKQRVAQLQAQTEQSLGVTEADLPVAPEASVKLTEQQLHVLLEVQGSFVPEKFKSAVLPRFKEAKVAMTDLRAEAGEKRYYELLKEFGAEKATDFEGRISAARNCYEALYCQIAAWEPKSE